MTKLRNHQFAIGALLIVASGFLSWIDDIAATIAVARLTEDAGSIYFLASVLASAPVLEIILALLVMLVPAFVGRSEDRVKNTVAVLGKATAGISVVFAMITATTFGYLLIAEPETSGLASTVDVVFSLPVLLAIPLTGCAAYVLSHAAERHWPS